MSETGHAMSDKEHCFVNLDMFFFCLKISLHLKNKKERNCPKNTWTDTGKM